MPSADEILKALTLLSNKYLAVAISWHTIVLLFLLFYFSARRSMPDRLVSLLFSLPLLSVSIFAWMSLNPFNGIVFLIASILLFILSTKKKKHSTPAPAPVYLPNPERGTTNHKLQTTNPIRPTALEAKPWSQIAGSLIFLSGLFYPHFLEANWWSYLYAAPVGLVPCPTLLVISGLYLILPTTQPRSWILALVLLDAFYGLFGVFKLNVYLDTILLGATIILILQPGIIRKPRHEATIQPLPTGNRA